jgi:hypothetical protein
MLGKGGREGCLLIKKTGILNGPGLRIHRVQGRDSIPNFIQANWLRLESSFLSMPSYEFHPWTVVTPLNDHYTKK